MITMTKISPSVAAARPRALAGASLQGGGIACAAGTHRLDGTGMSILADSLGVRPTYVPILQAFHVGDRAWSPPV